MAWVAALAVLVVRARPRVVPALLRPLRRDAVRRDRAGQSWIVHGTGPVRAPVPTSAFLIFGHVQTRVLLWLDTFSPRGAGQASDQLAKGLMGMAAGGMVGTGLGRGRPDITYFAESDFIIPSFGEELGIGGALRDARPLCPARRAGVAHGHRGARRLRQAARRGPVVLARPPVLRGGRRCDPGHPPHRPDHAVPVLRAGPRSWRTGRSWRSCCGSPTMPAAPCRSRARAHDQLRRHARW
jgi:hypothetical protein